MSLQLIGNILGVSGIVFGILFIMAAHPNYTPNPIVRLVIGIILLILGAFSIIVARFTAKRISEIQSDDENEKIDDNNVCSNCAAILNPEDIIVENAITIVNCPNCGVSYQITTTLEW